MNIGAIITGRPEGQESVASGLFQNDDLKALLYLSQRNAGVRNLKKYKGRVAYVHTLPNQSLCIVALYLHADSKTEPREGGFLCAAVCFNRVPKPRLILDKLFHLLSLGEELLDQGTKRFLTVDLSHLQHHLDAVCSEDILLNYGLPTYRSSNNRIAVKTEMELKGHLWLFVQSILWTPESADSISAVLTIDNVLISDLRDTGQEIRHFHDFLDYRSFYLRIRNKVNTDRDSIKTEKELLEKKRIEFAKSIERKHQELDVQKREIESEYQEIKKRKDGILSDQKEWNNDKMNLQSEIHSLSEQKKQVDSNISEVKVELDSLKSRKRFLESELEALQKGIISNISDVYNRNRHLREFVNNLISKEIKKDRSSQNDSYSQKMLKAKIKYIAYFLVVLVVSVVSTILIVRFKYRSKLPKGVAVRSTESNGVKPENAWVKSGSESVFDPTPLSTMYNTDLVDRKRIDLMSAITSVESYSDDWMSWLNLDWNFMDVLKTTDDYNESLSVLYCLDSAIFGSERSFVKYVVRKPQSAIKEMGFLEEGVNLNNWFLIGENADNYTLQDHEFGTDKRFDILDHYLNMEGNIYNYAQIDLKNLKDKDILMTHFRWLIYELSKYESSKDRDLMLTGKTKHVIPVRR